MPISYAAALQTQDNTKAQYGMTRNRMRQALTEDGFMTGGFLIGGRRRWR
jgi:hypothetical protein